MKTIIRLLLLVTVLFSFTVKSQVSVNVNIGSPPQWGPVGYTEVRYYYLPDVEAYYDVQTSMFIYFGSGVWLHRSYLPTRYRYYDLYSGYKVVLVDYHGHSPYNHFKSHKQKYAKGYHGGPQKTIGVKPGNGDKNAQHSGSGPEKKSQQKGVEQKQSKSQDHPSKGNSDKANKGSNHKGKGKGK